MISNNKQSIRYHKFFKLRAVELNQQQAKKFCHLYFYCYLIIKTKQGKKNLRHKLSWSALFASKASVTSDLLQIYLMMIIEMGYTWAGPTQVMNAFIAPPWAHRASPPCLAPGCRGNPLLNDLWFTSIKYV